MLYRIVHCSTITVMSYRSSDISSHYHQYDSMHDVVTQMIWSDNPTDWVTTHSALILSSSFLTFHPSLPSSLAAFSSFPTFNLHFYPSFPLSFCRLFRLYKWDYVSENFSVLWLDDTDTANLIVTKVTEKSAAEDGRDVPDDVPDTSCKLWRLESKGDMREW